MSSVRCGPPLVVRRRREGVASVVLELDEAVAHRSRVGAAAVVAPEYAREGDPEPAAAALLGVPLVAVCRVLDLAQSSIQLAVVRRVGERVIVRTWSRVHEGSVPV